jgi:hypothetical protein
MPDDCQHVANHLAIEAVAVCSCDDWVWDECLLCGLTWNYRWNRTALSSVIDARGVTIDFRKLSAALRQNLPDLLK